MPERRRGPRRLPLLLAPALAALPLAAYALSVFLALRSAGDEHRTAELGRDAERLALAIEAELGSGLASLEALSESIALDRRDMVAFREEARRLQARQPAWFTISLLDGTRQLMNLRHPADSVLPQPELPAGPGMWSGRSSVLALRDGRFLLRVPVMREGAVRGVLVAVLEGTALAAPAARVALAPGRAGLVLDEEGRPLTGGAPGLPAEALRAALEAPGHARPVAPGLEAMVRPLAERGWSVAVVAPVEPPPGAGLPALLLALAASVGLGGLGLLLAARVERRRREAARQRGAAEVAARNVEQERHRADLLSTVSHELRAPLTGLLGYTDLLLKANLPPQPRAWVEHQKRAGDVLLALIGDVLDLARLDEGDIALEEADIEIAPFLEEAASLMRAVAQQKGLRLTVAADRGLPRWVRGDPLRLRQVVTNLLSNAIKFTPSGEVTLAARLVPGPDRLEIAVTDTGPGIPPEDLVRIFDRFRQGGPDTARRFGGSGLGLAICRRLVTAMGGTIAAENAEPRGSRFVMRIPFRPGAAPAAAREEGRLRLLVAEDVPASRLLLQALLQRAGHEVTAVEDGALALAALHGANFDLGLIDLQMPGIDGLGVAAAIRRMPGEAARMPLVALTADAPEEVEPRCREAGFDAVLRKPFEARRLLGLIEALRMRRQGGAARVTDSAAAE